MTPSKDLLEKAAAAEAAKQARKAAAEAARVERNEAARRQRDAELADKLPIQASPEIGRLVAASKKHPDLEKLCDLMNMPPKNYGT